MAFYRDFVRTLQTEFAALLMSFLLKILCLRNFTYVNLIFLSDQ